MIYFGLHVEQSADLVSKRLKIKVPPDNPQQNNNSDKLNKDSHTEDIFPPLIHTI